MKSKHIGCIAIVLALFSYACNKEKQIGFVPVASDYGKLKAGNYWVYEKYRVDSVGNTVSMLSDLDSCYVESDTFMNGHTYYKMFRPHIVPGQSINFLRDSADCIVDSKGKIIFSANDFISVFDVFYYQTGPPIDTICTISSQMTDKDLWVTTAVGTFKTKNFRQQYFFFPGWVGPAQTRNVNTRYAKNIGIVTEVREFFSSDPLLTERRLIRYHVE